MNRSRSGLFRTVILGSLVAVGMVLGALVIAGKFSFPFTTEHKDHSPPPILTELREITDLHAAQAEFEVVIDEEDDVKWIPSALAGERVQFVAVGTVDAVVDLSTLTDDAIVFDSKANSVVVTLPAPTIAEPVLDHEQSHVMNRDRGLFNRLSGMFTDNPTSEAQLYEAAGDKMADAAAQSGLVALAENHAEDLLQKLITSLGVDGVVIRFEAPPTQ